MDLFRTHQSSAAAAEPRRVATPGPQRAEPPPPGCHEWLHTDHGAAAVCTLSPVGSGGQGWGQ